MVIVYIQNIKYRKMIVFVQVIIYIYMIYLTKVLGIDFNSAVLNLYSQPLN